MGTMLQRSGMKSGETTTMFGIEHPDILKDIHRQYVKAGSDIIFSNTFGTNRFKMEGRRVSVKDGIRIVVGAAVEVRDEALARGRDVKVALSIGPLGELLEPLGTVTFEEAYEAFKEMIVAGIDAGAEIICFETMTDLYEVKAAVLAAKENTKLPVMVSMSYEENERTFTGTSLEAMALTLEGLGVDAMGINCSLGPIEIYPMIRKLRSLTSMPVFAQPNAGLPDPETGEYDIACSTFIDTMKKYLDSGVDMIGGCCGTTPEYIKGMTKHRDSFEAAKDVAEPVVPALRVCSSTDVVCVDHITVIGERLNPTGKKRLKQALIDQDFGYILTQAIEQADAGADILDVNVGVPRLDDVKVFPEVIKKLQSVTGLPLQIDSSNPAAIEAALRVYNGKAIVNSVNGEKKVMDAIFPIVKKYGAAVIGLTLDDNGIPKTAEERLAIAKRIAQTAAEYGIPREDLIIDCLTLTASAQQREVDETLKAVRYVKERLGISTALGVSNVSFGLPARTVVNRTFLTMAMECGLDLPIINPNDEDMMASVYAFNVLKNIDKNATAYIERYGKVQQEETEKKPLDIFYCIKKGLKEETVTAVRKLLEEKDEMTIVNSYMIPALDNVGKGFEKGVVFLPQMLQSAMAAQSGFDVIKSRLLENDKENISIGDVVIATVKGDIHDIGKNIVRVIMDNYGFNMIDLGRDVPPEKIVETVKERKIKLVGLSALMTTTLKSMEETIAAVKEARPDCKVMVGGAVITADYAKRIGADYYCSDAMKSVEAAQEVFNG
ncbi:MAG: dihydropteroate synthase [Clostridiales bacterium]|nr:dihydropteroate synthase [Clostridiales bacterium]